MFKESTYFLISYKLFYFRGLDSELNTPYPSSTPFLTLLLLATIQSQPTLFFCFRKPSWLVRFFFGFFFALAL